ncbi:MAG: hypothetical protein IJX18_01455, partial [Clostridia bacterium]|nr:hypothetical protein [Clostridia bacterium]
MSKVNTDKKQLMKKSIRRACGKQRFAGFLYFLGTLGMAIASYFTLVKGFVFTTGNELNVTTFLGPLLEVGNIGFSFLTIGANFFCALLYLFTIVFCSVNALRALAKLDYLYMPGSRRIGFNQNAIAMDKLGKIFSSTFVSLAYLMYFTHMFMGAKPTLLFYIVTIVFLVVHFWAGIVGAKGSRFTARDGVQEFPRVKGRLAPFIRNVMQFALIAGLMYFMSKANIINNLFLFFNSIRSGEIFSGLEAN